MCRFYSYTTTVSLWLCSGSVFCYCFLLLVLLSHSVVSRLGLSHWDPYAVHRGGCLELYYCNMMEWSWLDSSLIGKTNWLPAVLWHCWFGHMACKNRPWYDLYVFGGMLNLAQSIKSVRVQWIAWNDSSLERPVRCQVRHIYVLISRISWRDITLCTDERDCSDQQERSERRSDCRACLQQL